MEVLVGWLDPEEAEQLRAQLKATQDKLERYIESTKKHKYDLRTELEAVKAERDTLLIAHKAHETSMLEMLAAHKRNAFQLKAATDKGFNEGIEAAAEVMSPVGFHKEGVTFYQRTKAQEQIRALKRKEVTE